MMNVMIMESPVIQNPYELLIKAAISIPVSHYFGGFIFILMVFLYNFLKIHFVQDLFTGFRGHPVTLTFSPSAQLYHDVVSKCQVLHGRYLSTPWLSSPHLQTVYLSLYDQGPSVNYRRELLIASDGGTVALDWVVNTEDEKLPVQVKDGAEHSNKDPIIIIVPGLTSDSDSSYIKHLASKMSRPGRKVVVINHRGLGGVSLTSDWFYHGGWTGDMRTVINDLHCKYQEAPLLLVGTSIGANMMVFYLGEDGIDVPLAGAAAICCPWDPLLCDRFLIRNFLQRIYSKALAKSLKRYALPHKAVLSRITSWEGIEKAHYCRDFDDAAFRLQPKCETVDKYYRDGCSSNYMGRVKVPLLCISSLDDPICTKEAIPWDECRLNDNIVLATTKHGGHLPFFEGLRGESLWWVRAVDEFFNVLLTSPLINRKKEISVPTLNATESIHTPVPNVLKTVIELDNNIPDNEDTRGIFQKTHTGESDASLGVVQSPKQKTSQVVGGVKKSLNQLSLERPEFNLWLIAFRSISTSWPFVGLAFAFLFKNKIQSIFSSTYVRK